MKPVSIERIYYSHGDAYAILNDLNNGVRGWCGGGYLHDPHLGKLLTTKAELSLPDSKVRGANMPPLSLSTQAYTTLVPKFEKHPLFADFGRKKHPFFNRNRGF